MLQVNDVHIRFGHENVIRHFSCHIRQLDFVCLTGKSGCGKSSLLKAFIGLVPFEGSIHVCGEPLNEKTCDHIRRKTAYLPQDLSFPGEYVQDIVNQTLRLGTPRPGSNPYEALRQNLSVLGLENEILRKRMSEISGGQRQRIILAAIALLDKSLWLLDEPTSALDNLSRNLVIRFLKTQQEQGRTIVAVSHDQEFAGSCSHIINLDQTE